MNCEHYQLMVSEFLDDALAPDSNAQLFVHLAECGSCRETLKGFIGVRVALQRAGDGEKAAEQYREVRYRDALPHPDSFFRRRIRVPMLTVVLVCAAFFASLVFIIGSAFTGRATQPVERNIYVISEPIEVRGYYSTHTQSQQ